MARDFSSLQTASDLTYHIVHAAIIRDTELRMEFQLLFRREKKIKRKKRKKRIKNKTDLLAGYASNGVRWLLQIFPLCWSDPS